MKKGCGGGCYSSCPCKRWSKDVILCGGGESMYWKRFLKKVMAASRTGFACVIIGGLITYVPTKELLVRMVAFTTYAPTIAISACDATLGKVVSNCWAIMQVAVFVMLETMLIFTFKKPPLTKVDTLACIGICSFIVTYPTRVNMMGKKVGLAQICMTFIAANLDPKLDTMWMPIKFLCSIVIGATAALLALILPYPHLAVMEVRRLSKSAVTSTSDLFETVVRAFFAADASTSYSITLHSKVLTDAATEVFAEFRQRQSDVAWEVRARGTVPHYENLTKGLKTLHLHLAGMELALQSHYLLQSSAVLRAMIEETLMGVVRSSMALLDSAANLPVCKVKPIDYVELIREAKEALHKFDEALFFARKEAFYTSTIREPPVMIGPLITMRSPEVLSLDELLTRPTCESKRDVTGLDNLEGQTADVDIVSPAKRKFMSRVTTYFFLFNVRLYHEGAMSLVDANWKQAKKAASRNRVFPRSPVRWKTGGLELERQTKDLEAGGRSDKATDTASPRHEREWRSESSCLVLPAQCTQCSMTPTIPRFRLARLGTWLWTQCKKYTPTRGQICKSLKISLAMMLATLFGMFALPNDSHCAWAPVTVAIFLGNNSGGSFRLAILRIQGTVLGCIYGFLVVSVKYVRGHALLVALGLWVTASDFIRSSKSHGYSGVVSAQTAATMILGDFPSEVKRFSMDRMTETFIGVMCFVFVEIIIFPERAVILVKREMIDGLGGLRTCVASIVSVYTSRKCQSCQALALEEIRKMQQTVTTSLDRQKSLRNEAVAEPDLWFVPFPGDVFARLISAQSRMLNPLCFMTLCLQATAEEHLDENMQRMLKPLQASLKGLEEQVVSAIDFLQALFIVPRLTSPLQNLGRKLFPCLWSRQHRTLAKARKAARARKSNIPLRLLGDRRRSVAGTPLHMKASQKRFEKDFEMMLEELVVLGKQPGGSIVSNPVMLALSSLSFCLHEIMMETVELEKTVYELLQAERPWSILDHWDSAYINQLYQRANDVAEKRTQ